tara:strand:+ start:203 stop:931 length:729 start_codon:yes stop_codon:yes gene_type:complete
MPKITLTEIQKGDALKVDKLNASMDSIRTASASLDADNVRIEGVDRRNFFSNHSTSAFASTQAVQSLVTNINVAQSFTYNSSSPGAAEVKQFKHHSLSAGIIGPFSWETTDVALKLNLSLSFSVPGMHDEPTPPGDPRCQITPTSSRPFFVFDIRQRTGTSGAFASIAGTERKVAFNHVGRAYSGVRGRVKHRGSLSIVHLVDISSAGTNQYFSPHVTIYYQPFMRQITIENYNFYGLRIRR